MRCVVEHRFLNRLICHQCGANPETNLLPSCGAEELAAVGPVLSLGRRNRRTFPDAKIVTLSSDMFGTARALKEQIKEIAEGG